MRIAIIDLGTNSVRFDVHEITAHDGARLLHREKLMVRLGQDVFLGGVLDAGAKRRTLHAFISFQRTAAELHVRKIVAFGTSALREATDSAVLLTRIQKHTGIEVKVISGQEEAKLIALGILARDPNAGGKCALVDIGGGSTEISICRGRKAHASESFPLGTARLQQVFLKQTPPDPEAVDRLRTFIRRILSGSSNIKPKKHHSSHVIGSSGTIRALAKILKKTHGKDGKWIELKSLSKLVKRMNQMTTTELLGIPGMESKRVDMILAGAILLEECMLYLRVERAIPSDYSLRDGILEQQIQVIKGKKNRLADQLNEFYRKGAAFGRGVEQLQPCVELAQSLFDKLKRLHGLSEAWKTYFLAAVIFRDFGRSVSVSQHEEHSYYIAKNADLPILDKSEKEIIALLCLEHESQKPDLSLLRAKWRGEQRSFLKALVLLKIVDALSYNPKLSTSIRGIRFRKSEVLILLNSRSATELEILRINRVESLFEKAFRSKLRAELV